MSAAVYRLHVGNQGAERLQLLNEIYGPSSRRLLWLAGLVEGSHVLELGCGTGTMSEWIAEQVGPSGHVVGVDASESQLVEARARCHAFAQASFRVADATATGLTPGTFDLVYMRLLLMHLPDPGVALQHAKSLLRPGGVLVCEEAAIDSTFCDPPSPAQRSLHELGARIGAGRGCDYNVARRLSSLVRVAGFADLDVTAYQPVFTRGEAKELEVRSFREALRHWQEAEPDERARGEEILNVLGSVARDEGRTYGLSMMMQVRARVGASA